jgi:uncharacterized protein YndB with AHSA1/START domain
VPATSLPLHQRYHIRAPVVRGFRTLTEPTEITRWFLAHAELPPQRGAPYEFTWEGGYTHRGKVLDFVRDRRLARTRPGPGGKMTRVSFSFRPERGGTRLDVRHPGYGRTPSRLELYGSTRSGWAYLLMNLKSVLEHGHDLRATGDLAYGRGPPRAEPAEREIRSDLRRPRGTKFDGLAASSRDGSPRSTSERTPSEVRIHRTGRAAHPRKDRWEVLGSTPGSDGRP